MPVVLDTDVVSFLYKRDTRARLYEPSLVDIQEQSDESRHLDNDD